MPELFIRTYQVQAGELEVRITYDRAYSPYPLDFDVLEDIGFSYGYEDEDQLTFYPNQVKLVFDDFKKINYEILKGSLGTWENTLPENHMLYGGVEILLNGVTMFKGFINDLSLTYDEDKLETSFEVVDLILELRNMNVDRDKIIGEHGLTLHDPPYPLNLWMYGIYKQFWPQFTGTSYPATEINVPGLFGFFIRHDWEFRGNDVIYTCRGQRNLFNGMNGDPWPIPNLGQPGPSGTVNGFSELIRFDFDSGDMFRSNRPCRTWADYIKLIALQFGATIGTMDYGKVYFAKRFGVNTANAVDVSDKILENNFNKTIHLSPLRGVVVHNHWNGDRTFEYGSVERTPNGDYKYENRVKTLETYVGSYIQPGRKGTSIYTGINSWYVIDPVTGQPLHCGETDHEYYTIGCWEVHDPQLNRSGQMFELVAKWQRDTRVRPKDKIEIELDGINYDMISIYRAAVPDAPYLTVNFRPMTMKRNILKNTTEIVGIEI